MKLTKRELQVLRHLADGMSSRQVAKRLGISYYTVKRHRVKILHRLGATSFPHAITIARDEHILKGDPWTT